MDLDLKRCARARLERDARFDGKFFIAVRTSGVYCRPICPARTANEANIRYFATAASAAQAGFRPCLRCRPECAPDITAWHKIPSMVSRALRLIQERGLEDRAVGPIAERLEISAPHLRRLFLQHLGATPETVVETSRLHFAKRLIDETNLPMGGVALAAGYGSLRRFNAAISKVYRRTPTEIRRLRRRPAIQPENHYVFRLKFRPPYNWEGMLAFLSMRATPGVEAVDNGSYRRTISLDGSHGHFEASLDEGHDELVVRLEFGNPRTLFFVIERIRAMFDLHADTAAITGSLKADPVLASRIEVAPGLRVPGCWNGFELGIRAILGQQVSVKGATTLAGRIAQTFGQPITAVAGLTHLFPTPEALADAPIAGLPTARAETIRALARAVRDGQIRFDGVLDAREFVSRMCELPGIGNWTAQYVSMRALGEPDAFPSGDLGLLHALDLTSTRDLEHRAEAWRPFRAYAAMYLWTVAAEKSLVRRAIN